MIIIDGTMPEHFCGALKISSGKEGHDTLFRVNSDQVELVALTESSRKEIVRMIYDRPMEGSPAEWLYGFDESHCSVGFLKKSATAASYARGEIGGYTLSFLAPMIVKSTTPGYSVDLTTFDSMEFYGGIVDKLYNPIQALEMDQHGVRYREPPEYTKTYDVLVGDDSFRVSCSVDAIRQYNSIPDMRRLIHSVLEFTFSDSKSITEFNRYYDFGMRLLQFCSGRQNIKCQIRLRKRGIPPDTIITRIADTFLDYSEDRNLSNVIRFETLDPFLPGLFRVLNEDGAPNLAFLPSRNKDVSSVLHSQVVDWCSAFEIEYKMQAPPTDSQNKAQARKLAERLLEIIDQEDSGEVRTKAKKLMRGLWDYSPTLMSKIKFIWKSNKDYLTGIADIRGKRFSNKKFKRLLSSFIDMRNTASHSSIIWNEGTEIYGHLVLYLYAIILRRSGVPVNELATILEGLFRYW